MTYYMHTHINTHTHTYICMYNIYKYVFFSSGPTALIIEASRSHHNQTHHTRWNSSGNVIIPTQKLPSDNTQFSQEDIDDPGGIRTLNHSKLAVADPCFWQCGNWDRLTYMYIIIIIIFSGTAAQRGIWPPRSRGFVSTHNDAPQSVRLLWTSD
jgi:hypothetical protein